MGLRAVFLGPPGAGKGTQAKLLAERREMLHVSSGDMLREHRASGTELGEQARSYMDRGALVPDRLIIAMVMQRIAQPDAAEGWLLDGFPRTLAQAESLDDRLDQADQRLDRVVYFDVPHGVLVRRLTGRRTCSGCGAIYHVDFQPPARLDVCDQCGSALTQRSDDEPDVVENRLEQYRVLTEPLLAYYRGREVLVSLDADRPQEEVYDALARALDPEASAS